LSFSLFKRIRRHAAISTGNFEILFKDIEMSPLPIAITKLLEEINKPEVDMKQISLLITSLPEISAQVLKMVNSSLYSLRSPVLSIQHAVNLLGFDHIRATILSFAAVSAIPMPTASFFNHQAFWADSLVRALVARNFASHYCPEQCDDAFTAMLIADVALPVLLTNWKEYYQPVVKEWLTSQERLSTIEKNHFGWNHAQAGAWIMQQWNFPEQLICFVGIHNADPDCIEDLQLEKTIARPLIIASLLPSSVGEKPDRAELFVREAMQHFSLSTAELSTIITETEQGFLEFHELLGLCHVGEQPTLEAVKRVLTEE
jgi:HD-like signal output (HDOD) protein